MGSAGSLLPKLWGCVLGIGLGFGFYACDDDTFECTSDAQCVTDEREGVCQSNGWCSFLDPDCPSLHRYGELAPAHIANTCVPVEVVEAGTGPSDPFVPSSGGSGAGTVSAPFDSTSTTGAGDETPALDESGSGGSDSFDPAPSSETGTSSESSDEGESSGDGDGDDSAEGSESESGEPPPPPPPPECDPVLFDDFDDGMVDNILTWHRWSHPNTQLNESGSSLSFEMTAGVASGSDTGVAGREAYNLNAGHVRIKIDEAPPLDTPMRLYLQMRASAVCKLSVHIEDNIAWVEDDGPGLFGNDTEWFQLRTDGVSQYVERSVDGVVWENVVDPAPLSCNFDNTEVLVFGGVGGPGGAGLSTSIDRIEVCLE